MLRNILEKMRLHPIATIFALVTVSGILWYASNISGSLTKGFLNKGNLAQETSIDTQIDPVDTDAIIKGQEEAKKKQIENLPESTYYGTSITAITLDHEIEAGSSEEAKIAIETKKKLSSIEVKVRDEKGKYLKDLISSSDKETGKLFLQDKKEYYKTSLSWAADDNNGNAVLPGQYNVEVTAYETDETAIERVIVPIKVKEANAAKENITLRVDPTTIKAGQEKSEITLTVSSPIKRLNLYVENAYGAVVKNLLGEVSLGEKSKLKEFKNVNESQDSEIFNIQWDATDSNSAPLKAGQYTVVAASYTLDGISPKSYKTIKEFLTIEEASGSTTAFDMSGITGSTSGLDLSAFSNLEVEDLEQSGSAQKPKSDPILDEAVVLKPLAKTPPNQAVIVSPEAGIASVEFQDDDLEFKNDSPSISLLTEGSSTNYYAGNASFGPSGYNGRGLLKIPYSELPENSTIIVSVAEDTLKKAKGIASQQDAFSWYFSTGKSNKVEDPADPDPEPEPKDPVPPEDPDPEDQEKKFEAVILQPTQTEHNISVLERHQELPMLPVIFKDPIVVNEQATRNISFGPTPARNIVDHQNIYWETPETTTIYLPLLQELEPNNVYTLRIPKELTQYSEKYPSLSKDYTWTVESKDYGLPPEILSINPSDGAENVNTKKTFTIRTKAHSGLEHNNEELAKISIKKVGDNTNLALNSEITPNKVFGYYFIQIPHEDLEAGESYTFAIPKGIVTRYGIPFPEDFSHSFTTKEEQDDDNDQDDDPEEDEDEDDDEEDDDNDDGDGDDDGDDDDDNDDDDSDNSAEIKITKDKAFPVGFNPLIKKTKITYRVNEDAKIQLKILTKDDEPVLTIINNKLVAKNKDHTATWNGTDSTTSSGEVVPPGKYKYKIIAKNPGTNEIEDIESGQLNVIYTPVDDFEVIGSGSSEPKTVLPPFDPTQGLATVAMQNNPPNQSSETGPAVIVYALLPFIGAALVRRRR